jgi:hypothetical protein
VRQAAPPDSRQPDLALRPHLALTTRLRIVGAWFTAPSQSSSRPPSRASPPARVPLRPAQLPSPETCPSGLDLRIAGTVAIPPPDSDADDVDPSELRRVPAFHEAMLDPTRAALLGPHDADRDLDTAEVTKLDLDPRPSSVLLLAADGTRCRGTAGAFRLRHDEEGPALLSLWRVIDGCAPVPDRTSAAAIRDADTHAACVAFPVLEAPETAIQAVRVADPTHRPRSCQAPSCDEKNRVTTSGSAQHGVVQILRWSILTSPNHPANGQEKSSSTPGRTTHPAWRGSR